MVYNIVYYFANVLIRIFYRKIFITGLENIPKDKPLLLVSNHPNGFLEPIIMACTFPIDLHFLVRGDLFEKKALRWLLVSTNQIPIYRFRDGMAALRNNQKTINKTIEILQQNKAVIIFAEGSTNGDYFVRELKKGMARMAFQCIDGKPDLDLHILPVGITFSKSEDPGTEVMLNVGKPIEVSQYYIKNAAQAKVQMENLTNEVRAKIQGLTLHIEDRANEAHIKKEWQNLSLEKNDSFFPRVAYSSPYTLLKNTEATLNEDSYNPSANVIKRSNWWSLLFIPLALPGFLFWLFPVVSGFALAKKYVKYREFKSSVKASASGGIGLVYLSILIPILMLSIGLWQALIFITSMFVSGIIAVWIWENVKLNLQSRQV